MTDTIGDVSPFLVTREQRVALYFDGPNAYASIKAAGFEMDYKKLVAHFEIGDNDGTFCRFVRANYFTGLPPQDEYSPVRRLVDWLSDNGFVVHTKAIREFTYDDGRKVSRSNVSPEVAAMIMRDAFTKSVDHVILFSGDADFVPAVREAQANGVRVTVVSHKTTLSTELRQQADRFIDIQKLSGFALNREEDPQ